MQTSLLQRRTRFRAYQLGSEGSSFSYFDGSHFTLIEARLTELNKPRIAFEMEECGISCIDCLHITSWDVDHCAEDDLREILALYCPTKIEYPGYTPSTETALSCRKIILEFQKRQKGCTIQAIDPPYIASLKNSESLGYKNILYHPTYLSDKSNDNSTVKLFRTGAFNVASLGDVEGNMIGAYLRGCRVFSSEVDVMILAHHGANNGFTTRKFLKTVRPTIAICSSNYDNKFDHPREEIRAILREYGIPLFTTKTGDVLIRSLEPHSSDYRVVNLKADSTEVSSVTERSSKKSKILRNNTDTIRAIYGPRNRPHPK